MRLFFAVTLPDEIIARVAEAQQNLRKAIGDEGVKWTRPEQFHYTLRFLGELPIPLAQKAIEIAQSVVKERAAFDLTLGGIGAFPNVQRPSTIWIGATRGVEPLTAIANSLEEGLKAARFRSENKPFNAHLTIARIKGYAGERSAVQMLKTYEINELGTVYVESVVLMQSTQTGGRHEYSVVEEFKLTRIDNDAVQV